MGWLTANPGWSRGRLRHHRHPCASLHPSDFGLVAIAMTVVPIVYLIADLGFGTYLMQADVVDRATTSTAFWYSAISATLLAGGARRLPALLERLFGVPGVAPVIVAITPAVLCVGLSAVPIALLRRGMRFRGSPSSRFSLRRSARSPRSSRPGRRGCVGARRPGLPRAAVSLVGGVDLREWPPRAASSGDLPHDGDVRYERHGRDLIALARTWGENAVISNVLGAAPSAAEHRPAARQSPRRSCGAADLPGLDGRLRRLRDDGPRLSAGTNARSVSRISLITPVLTAIAVTAPLLVPLLFGPQWVASVGATQALAGGGDLHPRRGLGSRSVLRARQARPMAGVCVVVDALTVLATALTARFGITAIALAFVAVAAIATVRGGFSSRRS